jgi:hypothetical protein
MRAAGVIATLVALVGGPAAPASDGWIPGEHGEPSVRLTVQNWGEQVDLSMPGHAAWAHAAGLTHVTVTIDPGEAGLHGFYGRLRAPDAAGGELILYCGDEYHRILSPVVCGFDVPMSDGVNRLAFDLQSASFEGIRTEVGGIIGGTLAAVPVLEARHPDGRWGRIPPRLLPGFPGELRYRILNTGDLPFRVPGGCQADGTVWPYQQLLCPFRAPEPAYATAVWRAVPIAVLDPVGGSQMLRLAGQIDGPDAARPRGSRT